MARTAASKPNNARSAAPSRKPKPLTAFFEPVSAATHLKSWPWALSGVSSLTALLALILVRSLATPDTPCAAITNTTEAVMLQAGSSNVSPTNAAICSPRPA